VQPEAPIYIEALYRDGVLHPTDPTQFARLSAGRQYRLLLVAETDPADHDNAARLTRELERRTALLRGEQRTLDLLGLFARGDAGPDFAEIEAALDQVRQERLSEWDALHLPGSGE
jgi:hypothetical protein